MTNAEDLLAEARRRPLTPEEITGATRRLAGTRDGYERYTILNALGHGATSSREEVEPIVAAFLEGPDAELAKLALEILCGRWDLTERYRNEVLSFVYGVPWDIAEDGIAQLAALTSAGEYLRDREDSDLLRAVARVFEDERVDQVTRGAAYSALARAVGRSWTGLPPASRPFQADDAERSVLNKVRERLATAPRGGDQSG